MTLLVKSRKDTCLWAGIDATPIEAKGSMRIFCEYNPAFRSADPLDQADIRASGPEKRPRYVLPGRIVRASGPDHTCFGAGIYVPLGRTIRASGPEYRRNSLR